MATAERNKDKRMGWKFWQRGEKPKPVEEGVKFVSPSPPHKTYRIGNVSLRVDLVMPDQHIEIVLDVIL